MGYINKRPVGTVIMAVAKRGFTVTRTPMGQLFEGATGDLRTVLLNEEGVEAVGGAPYHCAQDAIKYICEVNDTRAACIWNYDVNAETKTQLINNRFSNVELNSDSVDDCLVSNETAGVFKGLREFAFHNKKIAVVTFDSLLLLISRLNSGRANDFKQRFTHLFRRVLAGDPSLHPLIDHNAQSTAPLQSFARNQLPGQPALQAPEVSREKRIREECEETQAVVRVTASLSAQIREDSNITRDNKMVVILAEQKLIAVQDRSVVKRAKIATAEQEQKARLSTAEQEQLQMNADRDLIRRQKLLEFEIAHAERMSKIKLDTEEALVKLAATRPIIVPTTAVLTTGLKTVFQLASQMLPQWKHLSVSEQASLVNDVGRGLKNLAAPIDKIHESTPMGCFAVNQFTQIYHDQIVEALQTRLAKTARGKQLAQPRGINLYFAPT